MRPGLDNRWQRVITVTWERLLLYLALGLVLMWTVRMARSKGQNPWLWGGLTVVLMGIPGYNLLAVIPLAALMFIKTQPRPDVPKAELDSCPRCRAALVRNARFCTSCGWDLAEIYEPQAAPPEAAPEEKEAAATPSAGDVAQSPVSEVAADAPADVPAPASMEVEAEPEPTPPPFTPPKKPVNLVPPTAAGMTERGANLFNQGRIQESIDQFTKAIALDPTYVEAWARRAEAYAQLGRGTEADEDRPPPRRPQRRLILRFYSSPLLPIPSRISTCLPDAGVPASTTFQASSERSNAI